MKMQGRLKVAIEKPQQFLDGNMGQVNDRDMVVKRKEKQDSPAYQPGNPTSQSLGQKNSTQTGSEIEIYEVHASNLKPRFLARG